MTRNRRHLLLATSVIIGLGVAFSALPGASALAYSAKPIEATVVDDETGRPIEDVIVVAVWHLETRSGHGSGFLNVTEAVTDNRGVFRMEGWGPIEVKPNPNYYDGGLPPRLNPNQPSLILFKHGYRLLGVGGFEESGYLKNPYWTGDGIRQSYWNGKAIKLKLFYGNDKEYLNHLRNSSSAPIGGCLWTKNPRMTVAIIREGERLRNLGLWNPFVRQKDLKEDDHGEYCGSVDKILGPFLR